MYAEIAAAIQSAKALGELLKAAKGLANYNDFVGAVIRGQFKIDGSYRRCTSQSRETLGSG